MRILVVTADAAFAIGAARMHPEAKVLVASPNQLPSRAIEPFEVAVIDAGSDARNREVAASLERDRAADRIVFITEGEPDPEGRASLARPFTLEELAGVLGLEPPHTTDEDRGSGFLGRLLRRIQPVTDHEDGRPDATPTASPRVRAWPRMDIDRDLAASSPFDAAIARGEQLRELLDALPPVASAAEEAVALAVQARTRLDARVAVVWLAVDGRYRPHHSGDGPTTEVGPGQPVLSGLAGDVSAVLMEPPGPGAELIGIEARAVVAAGLRHAGRFLGAVAAGGRGFTAEDRDELLAVAREHVPRVALARTMERLRR